MKWLRRYGPAAAAAVLYQFAFAPFHLWLLIFVALVPWLWDLRTADRRHAWRSGLVFGWIFWLAQMNWLIPFVGRWTGSYVLAAIPLVALAAMLSFYFGGVGLTLWGLLRRDRVWLVPFAWAAWEALRSFLPPFAFPWGLAATPLAGRPELIQPAALGEVFLVSAWAVLVNVFVAETFRAADTRRAARLGLAAAAVGLGSWVQYGTPESGRRTAVTAGQPGVDLAFGDPATSRARAQAACAELIGSAVLNGSRLVVLPEAITAGEIPHFVDSPIPVVYGRVRGAYQSACVANDIGGDECADKTRLVMFGEYVPLRGILPLDRVFRLPGGDIQPGQAVRNLNAKSAVVGPSICFEALFPDVARQHTQLGATLLAVMSIDDWYVGTTAMDQLSASTVIRAVENGLPLVRSASQGYTFIVDRRGRVLTRAPFGEKAALRAEVYVGESSAFPWRGAFVWIAGLVTAAGLLLGHRRGEDDRSKSAVE